MCLSAFNITSTRVYITGYEVHTTQMSVTKKKKKSYFMEFHWMNPLPGIYIYLKLHYQQIHGTACSVLVWEMTVLQNNWNQEQE